MRPALGGISVDRNFSQMARGPKIFRRGRLLMSKACAESKAGLFSKSEKIYGKKQIDSSIFGHPFRETSRIDELKRSTHDFCCLAASPLGIRAPKTNRPRAAHDSKRMLPRTVTAQQTIRIRGQQRARRIPAMRSSARDGRVLSDPVVLQTARSLPVASARRNRAGAAAPRPAWPRRAARRGAEVIALELHAGI